MTLNMRSILLIACALLLLSPSAAYSQTKIWATVLDNNLNTEYFYLSDSNSADGIAGYDEQGMTVEFASADILSIWIEHNQQLPQEINTNDWRAGVCIELTDGQIVAMVVEDSDDTEVLTGYRLDSNLVVSIPLDRVRTLTKLANNRSMTPSLNLFDPSIQDDSIRLENDDLITGFITGIGSIIEIETTNPDGDIENRSFPIEQVHSVLVQNPPEFIPGIYVRTSLRERLRVSEYRSEQDGQLTMRQDDPMHMDQSYHPSIAELIAVDHLRAGQHLVDLASSQETQISPTGGRQWAPNPTFSTRLWIGSLRTRTRITSPVSMLWELPEGSLRFTMDIGSFTRPWTDNTVSIFAKDRSGNERQLWTKHFDATKTPREVVVLPVPADSQQLILHIDPAQNGAIQDQHFVGLPLVLVGSLPELQ